MGTKRNPGAYDCYAALDDDEPHFVLRAKDASSPWMVQKWAENRAREIRLGLRPKSDEAKVVEALQCADDMIKWRQAHALNAPVTVEVTKETPDVGPA